VIGKICVVGSTKKGEIEDHSASKGDATSQGKDWTRSHHQRRTKKQLFIFNLMAAEDVRNRLNLCL